MNIVTKGMKEEHQTTSIISMIKEVIWGKVEIIEEKVERWEKPGKECKGIHIKNLIYTTLITIHNIRNNPITHTLNNLVPIHQRLLAHNITEWPTLNQNMIILNHNLTTKVPLDLHQPRTFKRESWAHHKRSIVIKMHLKAWNYLGQKTKRAIENWAIIKHLLMLNANVIIAAGKSLKVSQLSLTARIAKKHTW
jgi:hypothetical protein